MAEPVQQEYSPYGQGYPQRQPSTRHPDHAYTLDPVPTADYNDDYYTGEHGDAGVNRPLPSQPHPGEY